MVGWSWCTTDSLHWLSAGVTRDVVASVLSWPASKFDLLCSSFFVRLPWGKNAKGCCAAAYTPMALDLPAEWKSSIARQVCALPVEASLPLQGKWISVRSTLATPSCCRFAFKFAVASA